MSTNHTRNYDLCQWEASDKVLREDFNADNAKIDAALGSHATQIAQALTTAGNAFSPGKLPVVTGSYVGDAAPTRTIHLGFRPRAVVVVREFLLGFESGGGEFKWYSGIALDGSPAGWDGKHPVVIQDGGFQVGYVRTPTSDNTVWILTNQQGYTYTYFAIR